MIIHFFTPVFIGMMFALILIPFSIKLANHYKLVDEPFSAPHKTHKNIVPKAEQDHVYHRLANMGMSPVQAVTIMHVAALLTGCLAFMALLLPPLLANSIFALALLCGLLTVFWLERNSDI